jgi:DNA-binding MarR family transcriptional regulator
MKIAENLPVGRVLANIGRLQASRLDQMMDQIGLYRGQAILLMILSEHDGLTHSEIAGRLQISRAAATKVIKRLEGRSFLQRRPDPSDERVSRVYILEDGKAALAQIQIVFHRINQILQAGFSPEEQEILIEYLSRIHANLLEVQLDPLDQQAMPTRSL